MFGDTAGASGDSMDVDFRRFVVAATVAAVAVVLPASVSSQELFQLVVLARDSAGKPVTDLRPGASASTNYAQRLQAGAISV
jgi:hypothetical protein